MRNRDQHKGYRDIPGRFWHIAPCGNLLILGTANALGQAGPNKVSGNQEQ